jgi:hypothetical protein
LLRCQLATPKAFAAHFAPGFHAVVVLLDAEKSAFAVNRQYLAARAAVGKSLDVELPAHLRRFVKRAVQTVELFAVGRVVKIVVVHVPTVFHKTAVHQQAVGNAPFAFFIQMHVELAATFRR